MRVPAPCAPSSPSALYLFDLSHSRSEPDFASVGSGAQNGRWTRSGALSGFSGYKVSRESCPWPANLLYLYTKAFDIVVDTFASGETVS
jgi:hypothetical protein